MTIRTRFAPSPTGFVHLGNIRSALYPWAFAKHMHGTFILRIEDTDLERSNSESVEVILQSMQWLGLDIDEGPFYQTERMDNYKKTLQMLLNNGNAYYCYMSNSELDALRESQQQQGQKPRYNGLWRPEAGKILPAIPENIQPVIRFKTPQTGQVSWQDAVKGTIIFENSELDDLIIARSDGTPTYNFCVVVDDLDMQITHVIRGDDHINNTPRQIHILQALHANIPIYGHLPTVLNEQGEKMSKRQGAIGVLDYAKQGYLPEAVINYLARLGWSHGDDEVFSKTQLIEWFDLTHMGTSAGQHNPEKLLWLNAQHLKNLDNQTLYERTQAFVDANFLTEYLANPTHMLEAIEVYKQRSQTLIELANHLSNLAHSPNLQDEAIKQGLAQSIKDVAHQQQFKAYVQDLMVELQQLNQNNSWQAANIQAVIKQLMQTHTLKMPQVGMPLRWLLLGTANTPSLEQIIYLIGAIRVLKRLQGYIDMLN